jgi:MFS family permease
VQALIIINALIALPAAVINTAITSLIPDLAPVERRGQVVSVRWLILTAVATIAALTGGVVLELMPVPLNYQVVLGVGAAISLFGLYYLRRIEVPDAVIARRAGEPGRHYAWRRLRQSLASVTSHRDFVHFTVASFVLYWGLYLPAALWSVLRVRDLGASDAWIGIIAVVVNVSVIAGYLLWGRAIARQGDRWVLIVAAFGISVYALVTALVPTIAWMIPTSILGGLSWAGCNLALFDVMLSVCPAERRASYVALYTAMLNVTAFAGPMVGAALSDWIGIRPAFVVAAGVRVVGALLFLRLVR